MRPLDVMHQIISRTKRAKDAEKIFNKTHLPQQQEANKFLKKQEEDKLKDKNKFNKIGQAYMTEFSRFQYKVDAIVNDAYLYVREVQPSSSTHRNYSYA